MKDRVQAMYKFGKYHPKTQYVSGRLASKNLQELLRSLASKDQA